MIGLAARAARDHNFDGYFLCFTPADDQAASKGRYNHRK